MGQFSAKISPNTGSLLSGNQHPDDMQDPSPLVGVQSKIAVAVLADGRMAEPRHGAPTTHILKVPQERYERDVRREHLAMTLSADLGVATARTKMLDIAGIPALLVERFDRKIDGIRVSRIHQEDFCQALGLPARHKYQRPERGADGYSVDAIRTVLDRTTEPAVERRRFVDATLFDILMGNVDGHAKNFALFHLPGDRIMTTPRYDVMPTMLDRRTTDEFAYQLGEAKILLSSTVPHSTHSLPNSASPQRPAASVSCAPPSTASSPP